MRLTLDWDDITKDEMIRRLRVVRSFFPTNDIEVYLSSSGKGFHVIVYDLNVGLEESFKIREMFWDDHKRLTYDKFKSEISSMIPTQILFTKKLGKHSTLIYRRSLLDKLIFLSVYPIVRFLISV